MAHFFKALFWHAEINKSRTEWKCQNKLYKQLILAQTVPGGGESIIHTCWNRFYRVVSVAFRNFVKVKMSLDNKYHTLPSSMKILCLISSIWNGKQCTCFYSLHSDIVPACRLSVQNLAQCDGTRIRINMEDHLLVCGSINGEPVTATAERGAVSERTESR